MRMQKPSGLAAGLLLAGLAAPPLHAQHGHLNSGALSTNQNEKVYFVNGTDFAESSGYVQPMAYSDTGRYAGTFNSGPTLTAFHSFDTNGAALPNGPAAGSFIRSEILSVSGPAGGSFSFWEGGTNAAPFLTLAVGFAGQSAAWDISDASLGAGTQGGDAFGHLHGRRFSTDLLGDYAVTFRFFDASQNGAGGGSIHAPSDPLTVKFSAVPEPSVLGLGVLGGVAALAFTRRRRN